MDSTSKLQPSTGSKAAGYLNIEPHCVCGSEIALQPLAVQSVGHVKLVVQLLAENAASVSSTAWEPRSIKWRCERFRSAVSAQASFAAKNREF